MTDTQLTVMFWALLGWAVCQGGIAVCQIYMAWLDYQDAKERRR